MLGSTTLQSILANVMIPRNVKLLYYIYSFSTAQPDKLETAGDCPYASYILKQYNIAGKIFTCTWADFISNLN